jgi:DnaJ-class molecular chaperone
VRLTVPAASQTGDVLRVRGKGLPSDAGPGDLLVHLMVQIPVAQSLEVATLVDKLAAHERKEPRADVSL